ncbi:hypothetical protein BY458DRAFT_526966 [Sporodiniella umbellata]|nr:hypothetical protein BY458DRAFT_526966 [Sporodiniella umbellata]
MDLGLFVIQSVACLTLLFGSWFETNGVFYQYFTIYSIEFNTPSIINTPPPVHLSFGLWTHCAWNTTWTVCSPVKIDTDLDIHPIFELIKQFNSSFVLPPWSSSSSSSWVRFIPLLLASCISVLSLSFYLLLGNAKKRMQQRRALLWVTTALCLVNVVLVSIAFVATLVMYSEKLETICSHAWTEGYRCSRPSVRAEVILVSISLGCFVLASLYPLFNRPSRPLSSRVESGRVSVYTQSRTTSGLSFFTVSQTYPAHCLSPPPHPAAHASFEPPNPSFAQSDRPLSHGSDNTFGAFLQKNTSSLLDPSDLSSLTDSKTHSHPTLPYSSNPTLGAFPLHPDFTADDQNIHNRIHDYFKK